MIRRHLRLIICIAIALLAGLWWRGHSHSGTAGQVNNATRITIATAQRRDVQTEVPLVGTVVPRETVAIKSRIDSQITEVAFHDGDAVKEGQVLFRLDDRELKTQLAQLEASLAKEKAQLLDVQRQNERMQKLIKTQAISQSQADDAKAAYETQLAQVHSIQASRDDTAVQLTYTTITAPISGRTGTISVTLGNSIKAIDPQPLVTINQISPIRVQFAIPQRYYTAVRILMKDGEGLKVLARQGDNGPIAEGKMEYIENTIDTGTGTFAARADFANEDEMLWPGMFVNLTLELGVEKNVLTIPVVAVQGDENNHFVFALDSDHKKAVHTPVSIEISGDLAIVTKGLKEGDEVATDGILRLTDGAAVEIAAPDDKKPDTGKP